MVREIPLFKKKILFFNPPSNSFLAETLHDTRNGILVTSNPGRTKKNLSDQVNTEAD
jgi:hypothetical protein